MPVPDRLQSVLTHLHKTERPDGGEDQETDPSCPKTNPKKKTKKADTDNRKRPTVEEVQVRTRHTPLFVLFCGFLTESTVRNPGL